MLNAFVKDVLAADPNANLVLAGDFNDYQFSGPIKTLTDDGATLTDLITTLPENQRYTYVFNGVSQVLDHIFVTKPVTDVAVRGDPQQRRVRRPGLRPRPAGRPDPPDHPSGDAHPRPAGGVRRPVDDDPAGRLVPEPDLRHHPRRGEHRLGDDGRLRSSGPPLAVTSAISLGTHTVKATSSTDGATATATLTVKVVLGTVTLSPPKVKSGKQVKVELFGWSPNATLSVLLDGSGSLGTVTTDATGYGQVKVTIPAGTSVGDHQVVVRAADGGQVTSALQVSR